MDLKFVVPDMERTFGKLEFAGKGENETTGYGRNERVTARFFHLYSSVQDADDIIVKIPGNAGDKGFEYETEVTLINPRIEVEGKSISDRSTGQSNGYSDYILVADNIVAKEQ